MKWGAAPGNSTASAQRYTKATQSYRDAIKRTLKFRIVKDGVVLAKSPVLETARRLAKVLGGEVTQ